MSCEAFLRVPLCPFYKIKKTKHRGSDINFRGRLSTLLFCHNSCLMNKIFTSLVAKTKK